MLATALISLGTVAIPLLSTLADRDGAIAERDETSAALHQEVDSANAALETGRDTIDELRTANRKLRAALPYAVAIEDVHEIRATATVILSKDGDTLDLN